MNKGNILSLTRPIAYAPYAAGGGAMCATPAVVTNPVNGVTKRDYKFSRKNAFLRVYCILSL